MSGLLPFGRPVAGGPGPSLVVEFDPGPARQRLANRRRLLRRQLISLALTGAVLVAVYLWQRTGSGFTVVYGFVIGVGLAWVAAAAVAYAVARRRVTGAPAGTAMVVDREGVSLADLRLPWPAVASLSAARGRLFTGPQLQLTAVDGQVRRLPWEGLGVLPATLDSAVRAFSAGRHGVDLSQLDN